jgi:transcriptional regulator NrdR family protein
MKCPFCHSEDNKVIDTRKFDTCVIRVRLCINCKVAWNTQEIIGVVTADDLIKSHVKVEIRT